MKVYADEPSIYEFDKIKDDYKTIKVRFNIHAYDFINDENKNERHWHCDEAIIKIDKNVNENEYVKKNYELLKNKWVELNQTFEI